MQITLPPPAVRPVSAAEPMLSWSWLTKCASGCHAVLFVTGLALAGVAAAQTSDPPLVPGVPASPAYDHDAYAKAEKCMQAYAVRFAATSATPQDVVEAALAACLKQREQAAIARAHGYANQVTITTLAADEPDLRHAAIRTLLEARYLKSH